MKIAFFDAKPYDIEFFDKENEKYNFEIKYFKEHLDADTALLSKGYDVVCAFVNDDLSAPVIEQLKANEVGLVALRCAGYNNVDLEAAFKNMHIVRVPAYSPYAVAEHALALIMTLNRKTHKAYTRTRDNNFNINGLLGFDINGKTVGLIGTGRIGQIFANIMIGLGAEVIAYDLFPNEQVAKDNNFKYVSLDELYEKSDIISLHCPLTKDTHHLINRESLAKMKNGVMIINTSRGHLVDTVAMIEALKSRKIGAAGLDVYEEESEYFFEDFSGEVLGDDVLARLLTFNNVLVTSHQAFFTREALTNIAATTLANVLAFDKTKEYLNEICYKCGASANDSCRKRAGGKCF